MTGAYRGVLTRTTGERTVSTTTLDSTTTTRATTRTGRATWTCPNCRGETTTAKKRCTDCGTSRW